MTSPIAELLLADAPHDPAVELFGQFVGPWNMHGTDWAPDGTEQHYRGRWDFGYILGGRAVQDVLYVDGLDHGTTVRILREDGTWDVVYATAMQHAVRLLHGRADGDRILITGVDQGRHLRWTFNEIRPDSFVWRGEHSTDGGATYRLAEEMRLTRP